MKSTVPVGTGETIQRAFAEQGKGFRYVSCPEFLKEGSAIKDFLEPDRVVIGDEGDWAGDAVAELYAPLDAPLVRTDIKSAEMVKLASNAFLATKISFINEIANVCEETGADVVEVAKGMGLDNRIGPKFLQAGIGFGGSCFPKDVTALEAAGRQLRLPLPAAELGDRGQRAAEAARDRQAREASRAAGRQADRAARARLQAEHRRHARGVLAGAVLAAAGGRRPRARLRPGGRGRGPQADPRRALRRDRRRGGRGRRRRRARHRVAGVRRARPGGAEGLDARRSAGRRAQPLRPRRRCAPPGSCTKGSGGAGRADAGADPRGGRGDAAAAADVDGAQAGRPAGRPAVHRVHARLAALARRRRRRDVLRAPGRRRARRARRRRRPSACGCATWRNRDPWGPVAR